MDSRDQSSDPRKLDFSAPSTSQYPPTQYTFAMETDLMSANYGLPNSYTRQLADTAASHNPLNAPQDDLTHGANGSTASGPAPVDAAMAPPQTPTQQSYIAAAAQNAVNASTDSSQTPQKGSKREKATRACDECRRKKVSYFHTTLIVHFSLTRLRSSVTLL
jgi:hypothetical protein